MIKVFKYYKNLNLFIYFTFALSTDIIKMMNYLTKLV